MLKRLITAICVLLFAAIYILIQGKEVQGRLDGYKANDTNTVIRSLPTVEFPYFNLPKDSLKFPLKDGKKLFLHFWATWCGPCEAEFPKLEQLSNRKELEEYRFVFVAVNDRVEKIKKFLKRFPKLNADIVVDNNSIHKKQFGSYRLPETFVFDAEGMIERKFVGAKNWSVELVLGRALEQ